MIDDHKRKSSKSRRIKFGGLALAVGFLLIGGGGVALTLTSDLLRFAFGVEETSELENVTTALPEIEPAPDREAPAAPSVDLEVTPQSPTTVDGACTRSCVHGVVDTSPDVAREEAARLYELTGGALGCDSAYVACVLIDGQWEQETRP